MDCVVYRNIDSVHLLLLTAAGWFIRAIAAVDRDIAVVVRCLDTQPGLTTLELIIATFCKQHGYYTVAAARGVNNLSTVSKPSQSRWWSARERETLGVIVNGVAMGWASWAKSGRPRVQGPPSSR